MHSGRLAVRRMVRFNRSNFGISRIDTPHWLNLNGLYRLPSPEGGAAEALLGGWLFMNVAIATLGVFSRPELHSPRRVETSA